MNSNKFFRPFISAIVGLAFALSASAQAPNPPPGGPGGPGGRGGRGGGFSPGNMLATQMLAQGDKNADQKLSKEEMSALADAWFDKLDPDKVGKLTQEQFSSRFGGLLPAPQNPPGGGRGGRGFGGFIGGGLFTATDTNKDGSLTRAEFKSAFEKWADTFDADKSGALTQEKLVAGLNAALPRPNFGPREPLPP